MSDAIEVPWIRSGTGATPADGGCVMQMADWIHRNEWTDAPPIHEWLGRWRRSGLERDRMDG